MKIKFRQGLFSFNENNLLKLIMRTFIFLCCSIAFAVGTNKGIAQNANIVITSNKTLSVKQVFQLINKQTDFKFIYRHDLIRSAPDITLKKGTIKAGELLERCLAPINFTYEFTDGETIVVKRKTVISSHDNTSVATNKIQRFSVSGTVTDGDGIPLSGANIVEKGTTNGVTADFDGNFSVDVVNGNATLVVSYIGFATKEIAVNGQSNIAVALAESAAALDEIVVVGYGTQVKKDLTGSVAVVKGDEVVGRSTTNVSSALQGAVSGVSVTHSNSEPGSGNSIRIRGITTLQGNSSPLILVDNVPVESIDDVNADQIESISFLKDGASASIYGSRAAAGVVIITTKSAKEGKFSLQYSGEFTVNTPTQIRKTVGVIRYLQMQNEQSWNDNGNGDNQFPLWGEDYIANYMVNNSLDPNQYPNTDWRNLVLKKSSYGYRHNLTVSGGTEKLKTTANFGYEYQDALYKYRDWKRITGRINNDIKISNRLGAELNFAFKLTDDHRPNTDPTLRAIESAPIYAALWQDGRLAEGKTGDNIYANLEQGGFYSSRDYLFYGKFGAYFKPMESLKLSFNIAPWFDFGKFKNFNSQIPYWAANNHTNSGDPAGYMLGHGPSNISLTETRSSNINLTTQALVNYDKTFDLHTLKGLVGYEEFSSKNERLGVMGNNFIDNDYPFLNQAPVDGVFNIDTSDPNNYTFFSENAYRSAFGRLAYDFDKKYLIQGSVRWDGSSRFAKNYRWGVFPSVSAGWVISEENFMKTFDPAISFLKFRASYGSLGNDRLGNYLYQSVLQFSNVLVSNGAVVEAVRGAAQRFLAIEDITWETTTTFDFGLDLNVFDNKLSLTADYYNKETADMLLDLSIPALSGYDDPRDNVGSMNTKGWEAAISWKDNIGDFRYSASFNMFDSKSIIGNIAGKRLFDDTGTRLSEEGIEFNSWYGYQSDGLFQTQEEVDNSAVTSDVIRPGDIKYKDISGPDGIPDGEINELDQTVLGGSLPRYQYGGNISLAYKSWDFGLAFHGIAKSLTYLNSTFNSPFKESWLSPPQLLDGNYWSIYNTSEENARVNYPRLSETSSSNNYRFSDFYLLNGAYFRIKNISLGYTLPSNFLQGTGISMMRLYLSGNDIFTIDHLPEGVDPEQGGGYLITKSYIMGIKVNF